MNIISNLTWRLFLISGRFLFPMIKIHSLGGYIKAITFATNEYYINKECTEELYKDGEKILIRTTVEE